MRARLLLGIALALACTGAAPAATSSPAAVSAPKPPKHGTPFVVATDAKDPSVAVDDNGTAHIVWTEERAGSDVTHYCHVLRGRSTCTGQQTFQPAGAGPYDFPGPKVVVTDQGDVVVLANRCCTQNTSTFVWLSSNGGASFDSQGLRSVVSGSGPSGEAKFGPGAFSVTEVTDTETLGLYAQSFPFEAGTPVSARARLNDDVNPAGSLSAVYDGTVAMLNATTPIVAFSDRSQIYYRRWSGSGNINSSSSWLPSQTFGAGSFPRLASGPKGVFMLYATGSSGSGNYAIAHYNAQSGRFGAPKTLDTNINAWVRRQDLWEDRSGNLHAAWRVQEGGNDHVEYSVSLDGKTWSKPEAVATAPLTNGTDDIHVRTGDDGGGFAVWGEGRQTLKAVSLAALGKGGSATCPTELRFRIAHALAKEGCFAKHGNTYTIAAPIRINGLDVEAAGAQADARSAAMPTITIDPSRGSVATAGPVTISAGPVKLGRQPIDWVIPRGGGAISDIAGNPVALEAGKFGTRLMGLPLEGYVTPIFRRDAADLPVNLQLPNPVDGALGGGQSSNVVLRTDQASSGGLIIDKGHFHLHVDEAFFGIAHLKPIDIEYTADPEVLSGHVGIYLPVVANSKLDSTFLFKEGDFVDATAALTFPTPGLPIGPIVYLNEINFHAHAFTRCTEPTSIGGGVVFSGGPQLLGHALVRVAGNVVYEFPKASCNLPGVLKVTGTGYLIDFPVADAHATFKTSGYFGFGAHIDIGSPKTIRVYVGVDGAVDLQKKQFYASGDAQVTVLGYGLVHAEGIVSSIGMGACVTLIPLIPGTSVDGGFSYKWGGKLELMFPDCDVSDLKPSGLTFQMTSRGVRRVATFTVPAGVPSYGVAAFGPGGPTVTLVDPQGRRITAPRPGVMTDVGAGYKSFRVPGLGESAISLVRPVPGVWRMEAAPSVALNRVLTGEGHPDPSVQARVVRGAGRNAKLVYRVRPIPGQKVRFTERGPDTDRIVGQAKGASGTLKFKAGDGRGGRRTIVALVEQDDLPRAQIEVAHYTAPPPAKPSRPRVRARRAGARLIVRWSPSRGAARYVVRAVLRDGRRSEWLVPGSRRRFAIPRVPGVDSGRILVAGISRTAVVGRPGVARVVKHPKRRKRHH